MNKIEAIKDYKDQLNNLFGKHCATLGAIMDIYRKYGGGYTLAISTHTNNIGDIDSLRNACDGGRLFLGGNLVTGIDFKVEDIRKVYNVLILDYSFTVRLGEVNFPMGSGGTVTTPVMCGFVFNSYCDINTCFEIR